MRIIFLRILPDFLHLFLCVSQVFCLFVSWLYDFMNVMFKQWQQPLTSSKGTLSPLSLFSVAPSLYALCLLLQCCFTDTAGMTRVRQPGPGTRWFHDSGDPCLANLPAAGVWGSLSLSLGLALSPLAFWLHLGLGCSQAWIGCQTHTCVHWHLTVWRKQSNSRLRRKGECRVGK